MQAFVVLAHPAEAAGRRRWTSPRWPLSWSVRLPGVVVALAMLALFVPAGAPVQLDRPAVPVRQAPPTAAAHPAATRDHGRVAAERAGINVDAVVDQVRHRVAADPSVPGALVASGDTYRARFSASGFSVDDVSIAVSSITRGLRAVARRAPQAWYGDGNVARRGLAPGITEQVTARAAEVEWDLVLASAPAGSGDLVVDATVAGLSGSPRAARNALVLDHLRMGELIVKDADGAELYRALPRIAGGHLRVEVPAAALAGARYPVILDPTISSETFVSGVPAGVEQTSPAVAFGAGVFLVTWTDTRNFSPNVDIYGARVTPSGNVLDPAGIAISLGAKAQDPAVAFNGTRFLVVWSDPRNAFASSIDVYGSRVGTDGVVTDPGGIPISTAAGQQFSPTVASDGANFLVAWTDFRGARGDVFGTVVSAGGTVATPTGTAISGAVGDQTAPEAAFGGGSYFVVWQDNRNGNGDVYGARLSTGGGVLDPGGIAVSLQVDNQTDPVVTYGGGSYFVVWQDIRNGNNDIYGTRVTTAGNVSDASGIALSINTAEQRYPAVGFGGGAFFAAWQDDRNGAQNIDIYGTRVNTSGGVLDSAGKAVSTVVGSQFAPATASDGTNQLVLWYDLRSGTSDVYGARVTAAGGVVLDAKGLLISGRGTSSYEPSVAFDGTNYLIVWWDQRAGENNIYATRVTPGGVVLDPGAITVTSAPNGQQFPEVAFDGTNYLVVWEDYRAGLADIFASRVSKAGVVLDPNGIAVSTAPFTQGKPDVAFDGARYLVAWIDDRSHGGAWDIYGARVNTDGTVADTSGFAISTNATANVNAPPAVAHASGNSLVAWQDTRNGADDIYGARVTSAGSVSDPAGLAISAAAGAQATPTVAASGADYLVVWADQRNATSDIYATRVTGTGGVSNPINGSVVSSAAGDQDQPTVALRDTYLVAWRDTRTGVATIYGSRVSTAGEVTDPSGLPLAPSANAEAAPSLAANASSNWGLVYQRAHADGTSIYSRTVSPK